MRKKIATFLFRCARLFRKLGSKINQPSPERRQIIRAWKIQNGESHLRYNYSLSADSIVFDLGGFEGDFTAEIYARYRSQIYVFEPHPTYARNIKNRFEANPDIKVKVFGLGANNEKLNLSTEAEASTFFQENKEGQAVVAELKNAADFLKSEKIERIHLIKINIEGGEYDLLEHLIKMNKIKNIDNLQIQFHHFVPNAEIRMRAIQKELSKTHQLTYEFSWLWENWQIK